MIGSDSLAGVERHMGSGVQIGGAWVSEELGCQRKLGAQTDGEKFFHNVFKPYLSHKIIAPLNT